MPVAWSIAPKSAGGLGSGRSMVRRTGPRRGARRSGSHRRMLQAATTTIRAEHKGEASQVWHGRPTFTAPRLGSIGRRNAKKGLTARVSSPLRVPGPQARADPGAHPRSRAPPPVPTAPGPGSLLVASRAEEGLERVYEDRTSDLSRLRRGIHLLGRRTGLLRQQGADERPAALPVVPGRRQAGSLERGPTRVPRRDLRGLRGPGRRAVRAAERPPGLLQLLLRQGPSRHAVGHGERLARRAARIRSERPRADPATGRPRGIMARSWSRRAGAWAVRAEVRPWASSSSGRWSGPARSRGATPPRRPSRRPRRPSATSRRSRS